MLTNDLVLGAIAGYNFKQIAPFVISLRDSGYQGGIIFWVAHITTQTRKQLEHYGVEVLQINEDALKDSSLIILFRFYLYQQLLRHRASEYKRVFITDIRDVVFQADPFNDETYETLQVFREDCRTTIGSCPINSRWIRDLYGDAVLYKLSGCPIICSGTTIGPTNEISAYIDAMCHLLQQPTTSVPLDQGVHNYLIHHLNFPCVQLPNESGPICTLGTVPASELRFDSNGNLLDHNNKIYRILHQYDRHPEVEAALRRRGWLLN